MGNEDKGPATDAVEPGRPAHQPSPQMLPRITHELSKQRMTGDKMTLGFVVAVHVTTLLQYTVTSTERVVLVGLVAAFVAAFALASLAPQRYMAVRVPLIIILRLAQFAALPLAVDVLRIMDPNPEPASASTAALDSAATDSTASALVKGIAMLKTVIQLAFMVAWLHGSVFAALGMQLPPLEHLVVQAATAVLVCRRATPVCQQFVGLHPGNSPVVAAAYEILQLAASVMTLGSCAPLLAVARAPSDAEKCVAVVWTLQGSLGLVLPTLFLWRAQLSAASKLVCSQHLQHERSQRSVAQDQLQRSPYVRLCRPALKAADAYGWAAVTGVAALLAFLGALL